jgi:hypothetical protein
MLDRRNIFLFSLVYILYKKKEEKSNVASHFDLLLPETTSENKKRSNHLARWLVVLQKPNFFLS